MKRILISGYYGFDNAGDEAVLAGLIAGINEESSPNDVEITALSINPAATTALHGIKARHRYKELLPAIAASDFFLSGGGSLLQDVTSAHGIFYYLAAVRIAQILGRKTMFVAQGIGPLTRPRSRKLTASVANRLDAITVRDTASSALLQEIGVKRPITVTADPALLLRPSTVMSRKSGVLLSMRQWPSMTDSFSGELAEAIRASGIPGIISPLNMYGEADAKAASDIICRLSNQASAPISSTQNATFRTLLDTVATSELVIGMRLHSLIFAAAAGVPSVALSYDPKVDAFMAETGQTDALIDIKQFNTEDLAHLLQHVWETRSARASALAGRLPIYRSNAKKNADIALNLEKL
jgi:polysaccharide pyruvyl transferase CsaB